MENIDLILGEIISEKEVKVAKFINRRVISNTIFYEISIELIEINTVNIYYKWNIGIMGKYLFKHIYKQMNLLYNDIKKALSDSAFSLNEIKLMS